MEEKQLKMEVQKKIELVDQSKREQKSLFKNRRSNQRSGMNFCIKYLDYDPLGKNNRSMSKSSPKVVNKHTQRINNSQ
jgi:hypothetical protein